MPLSPGDHLGPYEILSRIGAGGMGEVYKARDVRLRRTVAIKVLTDSFAQREDLRRRFESEARAVASLNHPHICVVHDIGFENNTSFMVMEHLEGETLATRLRKGPLPAEQALRYGIELAEALAQAHRKGICHRDVKPGNIMLTKEGTKLLDFGLVKRLATPAPLENTLTAGLTGPGEVLGTIPYMAPEQLEGKDADARTDIFALGAVLYEMVTGRRPFSGENAARLSAAILEREPPPPIPDAPMLNRLIMRCLAKNREDRWQTAQDMAECLRWAEGSGFGGSSKQGQAWWLYALTAAASALCAIGFWLVYVRLTTSGPLPQPVVRTTIQLPHPALAVGSALAVSPDGAVIAYVPAASGTYTGHLFVRRLDSYAVREVPDAGDPTAPCFSPDGSWLAFLDQKSLSVKKARPAEGSAVTVTEYRLTRDPKEDPRPASALRLTCSWGADGWLYFGNRDGVQRVSADGGSIETLTTVGGSPSDHSFSHDWPQLLPDRENVLFTAASSSGGRPAILSLKTKQWSPIAGAPLTEWSAIVPSGHLITTQGRQLLASKFDFRKQITTAPAVPVVEDYGGSPLEVPFAVSQTGSLVYAGVGSRTADGALVWVDRRGNESPIRGFETGFVNSQARLSPDNRWVVAAKQAEGRHEGIWKYDLIGQGRQQLTAIQGYLPTWRPDGSGLAFTWQNQIYLVDSEAKAGSEARLLHQGASNEWPSSWSRDGHLLAIQAQQIARAGAPFDIGILRMNGSASTFQGSPFNEREPEFSPRANLIAYVSDESGRDEIYLAAYPSSGRQPKISLGRGNHPAWSPLGDELFYLDETRMMAVSISGSASPAIGPPRLLFEGQYLPAAVNMRNYDVSRDGQRFLMAKRVGTPRFQLNVVLNWFEDLKRLTSPAAPGAP